MGNGRIFLHLGFFCILASVCIIHPSLLAAEDTGNPKGHDGVWVYNDSASGNVGYFTCTSINDSSSHAYTCNGNVHTPDGLTIPIHGDGFFTGKDTYRERSIAQMRVPEIPFLFLIVTTGSGRLRDENTADINQVTTTYLDVDADGVPGEFDPVIAEYPEGQNVVRRLISVFPDMPFPDYPEEP